MRLAPPWRDIETYPYHVKAGPAIDHRDVTLPLGQVTGDSARIEPRTIP